MLFITFVNVFSFALNVVVGLVANFCRAFCLGLSTLDKPAPVKTHVRDMIIFPEMVGATAAVYNGKVFNLVDIKEDMVGYYLAEFSISYNPVRHGRPGLGTGPTARFLPK